MLKDGEELPLRGEGAEPPTKVPAKIREIITKHLSTENLTDPDQGEDMASTADTLREENRMLQVNLHHLSVYFLLFNVPSFFHKLSKTTESCGF